VTLSDGNEYGIDCALRLQGLKPEVIKAIKDSTKPQMYKYHISHYVEMFDSWQGHIWITAESEEAAYKKYAKRANGRKMRINRTIKK
jgi:hypothetical protein